MTGPQLLEVVARFVLVFTACVVISRPYYCRARFVLGMAVASFAAKVVGLLDGFTR